MSTQHIYQRYELQRGVFTYKMQMIHTVYPNVGLNYKYSGSHRSVYMHAHR